MMPGPGRERLLAALVLLVMALFVASGYAAPVRWRRPLRLAAIAGFAAVVTAALVEIALWLSTGGR